MTIADRSTERNTRSQWYQEKNYLTARHRIENRVGIARTEEVRTCMQDRNDREGKCSRRRKGKNCMVHREGLLDSSETQSKNRVGITRTEEVPTCIQSKKDSERKCPRKVSQDGDSSVCV